MLMGAASQHPIACRICCTLIIFVWVILLAPTISAQDELAQARWQRATSEHFTVYSQQSSRATERFARELEQWRLAAASVMPGPATFPHPGIPNYVFVFDRLDDFQQFTLGEDAAFFYPTPRANFMALVANDATALRLARHHYGHFLLRNFADLRLPRWFEEGLSAYLGRLEVGDDGFRFELYTARNNEVMAQISEQFSMQRLFFNTAALASPRVIQIANLKAEALYYYLRHGYLERGFPDRRQQLQNYIDLLLAGRNHRFAYDRSFDVTTAELDTEFQRFLQQSRRPRVDVEMSLPAPDTVAVQRVSAQEASIILGDLALNGGRPEIAERFFRRSIDDGVATARSYSGLGDALRFQDMPGRDQEISALFEEALTMAPDELSIVLDYGEYWEAELADCDKTWSPARRGQILTTIEASFRKALELDPDNPEVNLAMGQLFMLKGEDWQAGRAYQERAFALLPAETFIMEQSAKYAIAARDYPRAEQLIEELAQPIHFFGEPGYVTNLRERLLARRQGESYDSCAE
jgi:tetratricopeptide (TPR) repeat protein